MRVSEVMTTDVQLVSPEDTLREAAEIMAAVDAGAVPVAENDRLVGMITDRDITVRAIAVGRGPDTKIREVMTSDIKYCFEDQNVDDVILNMSDVQIRRLPVVNRSKRLVGIVALGDIATSLPDGRSASALSGISQPGAPR